MFSARFGVWLYEKPLDKQDDCFINIPSTGRMVLLEDDGYSSDELGHNIWVNEFEDSAYDVCTYGYEDENGHIVPLTEEEFEDDLDYIERTKEWIYQNEFHINFDEEDVVAYGEGFWKINAYPGTEYYERRW